MRIQFLHDGTEIRSYGGGSFSNSRGGNGLFWWAIAIFLLLALATVSWFFSIMVFSYPEKPFNYRLLTRLEKLEPLKKYPVDKVPHGKFFTPTKLLEEYSFFTPDRLRVTNEMLKRDYIRNYKEHSPVYVKGDFTVMNSRPLTKGDVFTTGWVVVGRAKDMEDVVAEIILPGLSMEQPPYHPGDSVTLDNKTSFAAATHLQKIEGDKLTVTVVPLLYDSIKAPDGSTAKLSPPELLNMEGGWPVWADVKAGDAPAEVVVKAVQVTTAQPVK